MTEQESVDETPRTKKGKRVRVPFRFDDALQRAMRVLQPGKGTNEDYKRANDRREAAS